MLKRHSHLFLKLFILNDIFINAMAFILAYYGRFYILKIPAVTKGVPPISFYLLLMGFIVPTWLLLFRECNLYEPKRGLSSIEEFFSLLKAVSIGVVILTGVMFFYRGFSYSRIVVIYFWILDVVLLASTRAVIRSYLKWLRRKGYNQRYLLIVGAGNLGQQVAGKIEQRPGLGYQVAGFVDDDPRKQEKKILGKQVLGNLDDIGNIIHGNGIDEVIIALPLAAYQQMLKVINLCHKEGFRVRVAPDVFGIIMHQASIDELDGIPLIGLDGAPLDQLSTRFTKRIADLVIASGGLLFLSPLFVLIALLVKISSRGPVFYKQERVGLDHKPFMMYKFRSMQVNAETKNDPVWTVENDQRRTKVGTFLRKTSIDELPQLLNVLKGDMSLVGPRPERPYFVKQFKQEIAQYMQRHFVKAGITGWAQVNGWRGNTSIKKRTEHDIYYIQNWSLSLDLKILWLTIWKGFINKNAY